VCEICSLQAERECEGAGQAGQRVDDHGSSALRLRPCFWYVNLCDYTLGFLWTLVGEHRL
jgi:hypothetical protein